MTTSTIKLSLVLATAAAFAFPAFTSQAWAAGEIAPLQFTDLGGVKTWKSGGDTTVFVKSRAGDWYRADMQETCMKLDTSQGINFITELNPDTNEKQSKVVVARHICLVTSLKKVDEADVKAK